MQITKQLKNGIVVTIIGVVTLGAVLLSFLYITRGNVESLAEKLDRKDVVLYVRSENAERIRSIVAPFGKQYEDFVVTTLPKEGWSEFALLRNGTGSAFLSFAQSNGRTTRSDVKNSTVTSRQNSENSLYEESGIERFVETEEREIVWYDMSVMPTLKDDALLQASLFGGTSILMLPEKNHTEGRAYVSGGHLPERRYSAAGYAPEGSDPDFSLSLADPQLFFQGFKESLQKTSSPLAEGISGIVALRLEELEDGIFQSITERPLRIDIYKGKNESIDFMASGTMKEEQMLDLASRIQDAHKGAVRKILDESGQLIRYDVALTNTSATKQTTIEGWTLTSVPLFTVTNSPLFIITRGVLWVASNNEESLMGWLEANGETSSVPSSVPVSLHMDLENTGTLFDALLPSLGRQVVDNVRTLIGEEVRTIDLSAEPIGNGFLVRWNITRTSDENPTLLSLPKEALVK